MSIRFKNIDSIFKDVNSKFDDFFDFYHIENRLKSIPNHFWKKNIYLVSPKLMDIIYPPKKKQGIQLDEIEVNIEYFEMPKWHIYENQFNIAIGVYISDFNSNSYLKRASKFLSQNIISDISAISGPNIFICPERIINSGLRQINAGLSIISLISLENEIQNYIKDIEILSSNEEFSLVRNFKLKLNNLTNQYANYIGIIKQEKKIFNTLLLKVCYHELAHHYMSNDNNKTKGKKIKVQKVAYKLIEESFANAFAWSQFSEPDELSIIESFMDSQPFEYSAYRYWIKNYKLKECVPFLLSSWKHKINPLILEYQFQYYDEVFSEYCDPKSYNELTNSKLTFDFECKRQQRINFKFKNNHERDFWEILAKSIIYHFKSQ